MELKRSSPRLEGRAFEREVLRRVGGSALDFERLLRLLLGIALDRGVDRDDRLRMAEFVGREGLCRGLFHAAGLERELREERLALLFLAELFRLEERPLLMDRPRDGLDARNEPREPLLRDRLAEGLRRSSVSFPASAGTAGTSSARAAKIRMNR